MVFIFSAFCPYHLGSELINAFKVQDIVEKSHFEGVVTTFFGYFILAFSLILIYMMLGVVRHLFYITTSFYRLRKWIGLCYLVIKVILLVVVEIFVFPLICGVWLDICSLKLLNATIADRGHSFTASAGTYVFIHWLVGMIYIFYFAIFVYLLRECLRPGILWFLRNLNDPDFNPIQEMIQQPVTRHLRRFITSIILFGLAIVVLVFLPIEIINKVSAQLNYPILPYNISKLNDSLSAELSVELLWLHVILPVLLEQNHMRLWAKNFIKLWAIFVSWLLGLRSFLLVDEKVNTPTPNQNNNNNNGPIGGLVQQNQQQQQQQQINNNPFQFNVGMAHQILLQNNTPYTVKPFVKPNYFKLRVILILSYNFNNLILLMIFFFFFFLDIWVVDDYLFKFITFKYFIFNNSR
jgi:E3 ubiquitin-protein ligase MARCH6